MIKAVIFDIDGVLADSLNANTRFFQDIMRRAGHKLPTRKDIAENFHLSRLDIVKSLVKTGSEKEIIRIMKVAEFFC